MSDVRVILDWRERTHWSGYVASCRYCGRRALLRDDQRVPAHKVCTEIAIEAVLKASTS